MTRRWLRNVGDHPNEAGLRPGLIRTRMPPLAVGLRERLLLDLPLTYVADARDLANPAGLGAIFGVPDFLWVAGDGNAPTIGPALTVTGAPVSTASPWQLEDGSAVTADAYAGTSGRTNAVASLVPTNTDDIVLVSSVNLLRTPAFAATIVLGPQIDHPNGCATIMSSTTSLVYGKVRTAGGTINISTTVTGRALLVFVIDRNGNSTLFNNSLLAGSAATPAGAIDVGVGVGYNPNLAGNKLTGGVSFCCAWTGAGIADDWMAAGNALVSALSQRFTGIHPSTGTDGSFTRASAASWQDRSGIWHIASPGLPRAGDSGGLRAAQARTNLCYNNINISGVPGANGWSHTAGAHTKVDDSVALAAAGAEAWGPNVVQIANASGGDSYLYGGAVAAAVPHSLSCLARITAGSGAEIGWRDSSSGAWTKAGDISDGYATRTVVHGSTPPDTDCQFAIRVPNGCTIRVIAQQLEAGSRCTTPIPNWATAASAARAAEVLTTSHTPNDTGGRLSVDVAPLGWSNTQLGVDTRVLSRAGGASGLLLIESGAGGHEATDGTNTVTEATVPVADGVYQTAQTAWGGTTLAVSVDGAQSTGSYDSALQGAGAMTVAPDQGEVAVQDLKAYE